MNKISRILSGIGLLLLGLLTVSSLRSEAVDFFSVVWIAGWGLLLIGLAVYLFMNKKEDEIEEIKSEDN